MNLRMNAGMCAAAVCALAISLVPVLRGQESEKPRAAEKPHAVSKSGKKLFGAMDALHVHNVSNVHVSHDGMRIAFTATELAYDTEGDPNSKWKSARSFGFVGAGPNCLGQWNT